MFGRHFDETNQICSWQTRKSIDALKEFYRDEMTMDDWKLIKALKTKYNIEWKRVIKKFKTQNNL